MIAAQDHLLNLHFEIVMLRPTMESPAGGLWEQTKSLVEFRLKGTDYTGRTMDDIEGNYLDAWSEFRAAATKDLGTGLNRRERLRFRIDQWRMQRHMSDDD
jgi:hypothetical protein